jgi:RNA polymerase sigma-70 factor, ECF subfamily
MTRNDSNSHEPYVSVGPSGDARGPARPEPDLEAQWRSVVGRRSFLKGVGLASPAALPGSALFASSPPGTGDSGRAPSRTLLEPTRLPDHIDALYRAALALTGSRHDAEDLVQETFARVVKRPRFVRRDRELWYLLRAMRNTYSSRYRTAARRPSVLALVEEDVGQVAPEPRFNAQEIMQAVASAPAAYRDAVIAVDIMGMTYREAARALRAREATITTRLHRGRQHVARVLVDGHQAN